MTQHNTIEYEITIIPIVKINLQVGKSRFADRALNKQDMQNKNEELPSPPMLFLESDNEELTLPSRVFGTEKKGGGR